MSQKVEDQHAEYFEECYAPTKPKNSNEFCDFEYPNATTSENSTCKRDFCLMCCNLRDIMFNKKHSFDAIVKCQQSCVEIYKDPAKLSN